MRKANIFGKKPKQFFLPSLNLNVLYRKSAPAKEPLVVVEPVNKHPPIKELSIDDSSSKDHVSLIH